MFGLMTNSETLWHALAAMLTFSAIAAAQVGIRGLCNTGQIRAASGECTETLVTPNPPGGGTATDNALQLAYPYPFDRSTLQRPCLVKEFIGVHVDTPDAAWLPNDLSTASEWITSFGGENNEPKGWYVYRTAFPIPTVLPGGAAPTGVRINGQLASDDATVAIFLESPAGSASCSLVAGQRFPVNPSSEGHSAGQWWLFSFTTALPIGPGAGAYLYFVVANSLEPSPTGLRVQFFGTSVYN